MPLRKKHIPTSIFWTSNKSAPGSTLCQSYQIEFEQMAQRAEIMGRRRNGRFPRDQLLKQRLRSLRLIGSRDEGKQSIYTGLGQAQLCAEMAHPFSSKRLLDLRRVGISRHQQCLGIQVQG